ncbi:MAG TPA: class I SAM-dependent methyltransferase [Candidatus Paceibacterota bacterium]
MSSKTFWDKEYAGGDKFSLSERPAEDLLKFCRWLEREFGKKFLNPTIKVLDLGCGNGRNLIHIAQTYGVRGVGYDLSDVAIKQAKRLGAGLDLDFVSRSIAGAIDLPDASVDMVFDMMSSHYLPEKERLLLIGEIGRVLKPGGWFFYKTFLLDGDINAGNLLRKFPANEKNSYIHPTIGSLEHVSMEAEIRNIYEPYFEIKKVEKSGKFIIHGRAGKRRSIIVYMERKY